MALAGLTATDWLNAQLRKVSPYWVWGLSALPLLWLIWATINNQLGVDPVKAIEHRLGLWGLQFLLASLCVTPLRRLGVNLLRFRRAIGVWSCFYILLHLLVWLSLDMGLRLDEIGRDLVKRPYIILGMIGLLALLPLALTSTNAAIRRLGAKRWQNLHRLSYLALAAGVAHFILVTKGWQPEPLIYGGASLLLLALRLVPKKRRVQPTA